jgi:hypothetical protein
LETADAFLTGEEQAAVLAGIGDGLTLAAAAVGAGVHPDQVKAAWTADTQFASAVEYFRGLANLKIEKGIIAAADDGDLRALTLMAERRIPEYARQLAVKQTTTVDVVHRIETAKRVVAQLDIPRMEALMRGEESVDAVLAEFKDAAK